MKKKKSGHPGMASSPLRVALRAESATLQTSPLPTAAPRLLELCSGSGSLSRVARARGWEALTLDIDPRTRPDLVQDIREFDPTAHGEFDWVHASPPCQFYSIACTWCPRDFERGDQPSLAALRILEHYSMRGACCTMRTQRLGISRCVRTGTA